MDWDAYRALDRMNASTLVAGCKSMLNLKDRMANGFGDPTHCMTFGSQTHCMVLEPEDFTNRYIVMPDFHKDPDNMVKRGKKTERSFRRGTTYDKKMVAEFKAANTDKEVMPKEDYETALQMLEAIHAKPEARDIIDGSKKEVTLLGEINGVLCKSRLDLFGEAISDLKGTNDVSEEPFWRTFENLRYGFRFAFYRELAQQNDGYTKGVRVIAAQDARPFDVVVYEIPEALLDAEMCDVRAMMDLYSKCMETGVWPGVDGGRESIPLAVPDYRMTAEGEFQTALQKSQLYGNSLGLNFDD